MENDVAETILGLDFRRATFAGATRFGSSTWVRVTIRPVELRGERQLQFSYFDGRKTLTHNHRGAAAKVPLDELLALGFAGVHITTATEEIDVRTTKKGKISISRRKADVPVEMDLTHNRVKDAPLPEGRADALLEVMGITTADGRVRPTMRAKFTQINEFLKHLEHCLDDAGLRSPGRELSILDCGCGSSYLTLAAHHYLNDVLQIPARILGVDVNDEVIRKSVERVERLAGDGPAFTCGKIGTVDTTADIVIALHACDTATDDAISQAVRCEARLLLCAPCCHHDLNKSIRPEGPAAILRPLLRHGILKERTADLVTDAFRALTLRIMGYRTDVVEFVSPEHTARNLLIRAVRGPSIGDADAIAEYVELRRFWCVVPYIERALGEPFQQLVAGSPGMV
jgi:SAM-dependent methyltransferase